jgi:hypothetical protein
LHNHSIFSFFIVENASFCMVQTEKSTACKENSCLVLEQFLVVTPSVLFLQLQLLHLLARG